MKKSCMLAVESRPRILSTVQILNLGLVQSVGQVESLRWKSQDLVPPLIRLDPASFSPFGVPELTAPTTTERTIMIPPAIGIPTICAQPPT